MKKTKTILSVLLTAAMLLTMFTAVPFSVSAADGEYHVTNSEEFWNAQNDIKSHNSGTYDVYIDASFESTYGFSVDNPVTVNFYGEGNTLTFTAREQCIDIVNGATVNLGSPTYKKTFTISGKTNVLYNDCAGAVHVWGTSSTCNMYDGVTIKDRKGNNYLGGGVTVESGTFNMYGGTIDKCGIDGGNVCYGGGVAVYNGGTFVMNGGVIKDCYVTNTYSSSWQTPKCAGGGVFVWRSTFVMNCGEICNCSASSNDAIGGGIAVVTSDEAFYENGKSYGCLDSIFTMNSGKVDKCTASVVGGGLAVGMAYLNLIFCCTDSTILSGPANPGMIINGGEMSDNEASQGGAVFLNWIRDSRPVQIKNMTFKNNDAATGGAISVFSYWTQAQIDGCTFTGNTAEANGAAISLLSNTSSGGTHIKDTTITGNTITDPDNDLSNRGAGVYYDANSKLTISGANIIQNNKYNNKENNLNVLSKDKPVYVDGDLTGSKVGLSDPSLWGDNMTDAEAPDDGSAELLTKGYKANNPDVHPSEYFTSDHETWFVDRTKKTITKIDDPNSKSYREYTVKRYEYIPASDPKMNPLYGQPDEYVVSDIKNPDIQNITSFADLYNEIKYKYSDTSKYTKGTDVNSNGNIYLQYTILDNTYPTTVTLNKQSSNSYATIEFSQSPLTGKGGKITYRVFLSDQTSYANSKEIVYRIGGNSSLTQYYVFSDTCTTETVKYVNATPPSDTLYEYDDYGNLIAKLEIEGGKNNYTIQKTQIETVTGNDNEVRLVRKTTPVKFHDNKDKVGKGDDKLFRVYNAEKPADFANITEDGADHSFNNKGGVDEFYSIPKFAEDDYVFAGWYTVADNDDNSESKAFEFNSFVPADVTDVYAHWIPVGEVDKDADDDKELPSSMNDKYKGFDLCGVQIRPKKNYDYNYVKEKEGGLRFVASISESLLSKINAVHTDNKIEYGFVSAEEQIVKDVVKEPYMNIDKDSYTLQYKGENVNGVDTLLDNATRDGRKCPNNFRYITNVDCTSKVGGYGSNPNIKLDHRNFTNYRLASYVVTYKDDESGANKIKNVAARAYLRYTDANGLLRTFYNDYDGTNFYGGCSTSYSAVENMATNTKTVKN